MTIPPDIWLSTATPPRRQGVPGLFLDRDGVLVKEVNYLKNKEDVALEAGAAEIISWARAKGLGLVCVTNQSGIARGRISWAEFEAVETEIARQLRERDVTLDLTIACPFHPDFTKGYGPELDRWRKPGPAMIEHGAALMGLDLAKSWLVGDKAADIKAAKRAGLRGAVIVATGYGAEDREAAMAQETEGFTVLSATTLDEARELLEGAF